MNLLLFFMLLALTRRPAPLGISFRVDAGCVDIIGINGMPRITFWGTWGKTNIWLSVVDEAVRLGPTVGGMFPELPTGLEGIRLLIRGRLTDTAESTTRRNTWIFTLRGNDETLRRGRDPSVRQQDRASHKHHHNTRATITILVHVDERSSMVVVVEGRMVVPRRRAVSSSSSEFWYGIIAVEGCIVVLVSGKWNTKEKR